VSDDPVEGMARAMCRASEGADEAGGCACERTGAACYWPDHRAEARAAWVHALAALHGIDHATLRLAFGDFPGALIGWQAAVRAFAREHGLETPDAG
jgi:hypothetical protein